MTDEAERLTAWLIGPGGSLSTVVRSPTHAQSIGIDDDNLHSVRRMYRRYGRRVREFTGGNHSRMQ